MTSSFCLSDSRKKHRKMRVNYIFICNTIIIQHRNELPTVNHYLTPKFTPKWVSRGERRQICSKLEIIFFEKNFFVWVTRFFSIWLYGQNAWHVTNCQSVGETVNFHLSNYCHSVSFFGVLSCTELHLTSFTVIHTLKLSLNLALVLTFTIRV